MLAVSITMRNCQYLYQFCRPCTDSIQRSSKKELWTSNLFFSALWCIIRIMWTSNRTNRQLCAVIYYYDVRSRKIKLPFFEGWYLKNKIRKVSMHLNKGFTLGGCTQICRGLPAPMKDTPGVAERTRWTERDYLCLCVKLDASRGKRGLSGCYSPWCHW